MLPLTTRGTRGGPGPWHVLTLSKPLRTGTHDLADLPLSLSGGSSHEELNLKSDSKLSMDLASLSSLTRPQDQRAWFSSGT